VNTSRRLERLEARVSRSTDNPDDYCLACLGPGGYRQLVDRARSGVVELPRPLICRGCGGPSFHGAIVEVRRQVGLA
jgi:hypothetical protein